MILPEQYVNNMRELLGDGFDSYMESLDKPRHYGLRANTLKATPEQLKDLLAFNLEPVPWCGDGFYYSENERPAKSPFYNAGLFYIQEPSAMAAVSLLDISAGDKVLDLCAAPGGKSCHAAAKLGGSGVLVSNDVSASRIKALVKNLELSGVTNAVVLNEPPERLSERFAGYFDKIIIDAPCSGEGMFRKDPSAVKSWSENKPAECARLQTNILFHAAKMLAPSGEIVYSTCTFGIAENEAIIADFLSRNADFEGVPMDSPENRRLGFDAGFGLNNAVRLWPHKINGEGHFVARLRKSAGGADYAYEHRYATASQKGLSEKDASLFHSFCDEFLNVSFRKRRMELHGISLYVLPETDYFPDLRGIRVCRSGFYVGDIKPKRFEPSQALAMGLRREDAKIVIDFNRDSPETTKYLKGDSFETGGADGWALVCMEGFPLGWGKVKDGRMKNKYLKGWI